METPDMGAGVDALLPVARSEEDVEWRRQLDLKWFGMGGAPRIRLFGGQYIPETGEAVWERGTPGGGGLVRTRILARPWFRLAFALSSIAEKPDPVPWEVSPLDVLSPPPPERVALLPGFVVDLLVDDYVFDRKKLRLQWRCRADGEEPGDGAEAASGVLSGRLLVTLDAGRTAWELSEVVKAVRSAIQGRGVTDERLVGGGFLPAPHPDNPFVNADDTLVFVAGCWLSLHLGSLTFQEGVEYPLGYGRTGPLWMPLSRDRYYMTDALLREDG